MEISKVKTKLQGLLNGGDTSAIGAKDLRRSGLPGDRNYKFFHATTIQRRDGNRLHRLMDNDGNWVEKQSNIMKAIKTTLLTSTQHLMLLLLMIS